MRELLSKSSPTDYLMNSDQKLTTSDRTFKVWEYQISHGQLLIRSPKAPAVDGSPELLTNLDLVCLDVEYMAVARVLRGLELQPATADEIRGLESLLGKSIEPSSVRILVSGGKRFPIVARSFAFSENDWDIFESPFEFRSRFRGT